MNSPPSPKKHHSKPNTPAGLDGGVRPLAWHEFTIQTHCLVAQRSDYASAFRDSADALVCRLHGNEVHPPLLLHPLVFLYRQYLQLEITRLSHEAWAILGEAEPVQPDFIDLGGQWRLSRAVLASVLGDLADADLRPVGELIASFTRASGPMPTGEHNPPDARATSRELQRIVAQAADLLAAIDVRVSALAATKSMVLAPFVRPTTR